MKISLIVPCYNEEAALPIFYDETKKYGNCGNFNEYENAFSKKLLKEENTCGYTRMLTDVQSTRRKVKNRGGK